MPQPLCDGVGVSLISLTVAHDFDVKQFFGIFWSLVPYAFLAVLIFGLFFTQRMSLLIFVVLGLIVTAINEFAIKNIHEETRPPRSCLDSGGFPSGHAMISVLYLTWMTIEAIIHPNWTWRKKLAFLIPLWCLLAPCAPFRHPGGDHSWNQIAGGVVVGFVSGLILFAISQFIVIRYLEYIMAWKITKFFHIRNDIRPQFQHSKNKGAKAPTKTVPAFPDHQRVNNDGIYTFAHILPISIQYILGALGIILGSVKKHDSDCNRSSGPVIIGVGLWTFIAAIGMTIAFVLSLRRRSGKSWAPEFVQGLIFATGVFLFEGFFWGVAGVKTSTEDENCAHKNLTFVYAIVWFAVQIILLLFVTVAYILLDIRRDYGFKKNVVAHPNGSVQPGTRDVAPNTLPDPEKGQAMEMPSMAAA